MARTVKRSRNRAGARRVEITHLGGNPERWQVYFTSATEARTMEYTNASAALHDCDRWRLGLEITG